MAQYQIHNREGVNFVEILLNNETVRTESGALRYMRGNIVMESKAPGVGGFLKSMVTQESIFRPIYKGTGQLVLEPSLTSFYSLTMTNDSYTLDQGSYWASDASIEISAKANKAAAGLLGGEGFFQTHVQGSGTVILSVPGPVEILELKNERLVVDGSFAVARSTSLNFKMEKSTKSLFGSMTSGEGLVSVFEGTGRVYLAPVPNLYVMLAGMMASAGGGAAQGSKGGGMLSRIADNL